MDINDDYILTLSVPNVDGIRTKNYQVSKNAFFLEML